MGNGIHALIEVNQAAFPPDDPDNFQDTQQAAPLTEQLESSILSQGFVGAQIITVFVAYTTAAAENVSNIQSLIQLAVDETNQSYQNSNVSIHMILTSTMELNYWEWDPNCGWFSGCWKPYDQMRDDLQLMPDVAYRRNYDAADIVVMLYHVPEGRLCGLATGIGSVASTAYAIVETDCATGRYSFAHEIGHLQGARHDFESDDLLWPYSYGHGFRNTQAGWSTIMATWDGNRIPYWSNPSVSYNGQLMGTEGLHNNARVLNETASSVSGFRTTSSGGAVSPVMQRLFNSEDVTRRILIP